MTVHVLTHNKRNRSTSWCLSVIYYQIHNSNKKFEAAHDRWQRKIIGKLYPGRTRFAREEVRRRTVMICWKQSFEEDVFASLDMYRGWVQDTVYIRHWSGSHRVPEETWTPDARGWTRKRTLDKDRSVRDLTWTESWQSWQKTEKSGTVVVLADGLSEHEDGLR